MANFSDTELGTSVSKFVKTEVKTERTDLGPLSTEYAFDEAREFFSSTLVFDPSAIFYLLSLAANRVNKDVIQALEYLDDIITAIDEVGGDTTKVTQTSLLADAAAALIEAERTISGSNAIAARPFSRYQQALDTFTAKSLTPNIRRAKGAFPSTYEIVRPPQQAQSSIRTNITELRDLHEAVVAEAEQLTLSMDEFLDANLPLAAIQNSVPKVRNDLRSLKIQFDDASKDGAIEITRDAFLSIHAGMSVVTNLTSISDPRESRMKSSSSSSDRAAAVSSASSLALSRTPAEVQTAISAPFVITPATNELRIEVDGGAEQLVTLEVPSRAFVDGSIGGPYIIQSTVAAILVGALGPVTVPAGNYFSIYADGVGYEANLTIGSRTASQLAVEINAATRIDGSAGTFNDVGTALNSGGVLIIVHDTPGDYVLSLGRAPVLNPLLGFPDEASQAGQQANNQIRFIVEDEVEVIANLADGTQTAAQIAASISLSPLLEAEEIVITTSTGTITAVRVSSSAYGQQSHVKIQSNTTSHEKAVETFGFFEEQEDRGDYLKLEDLDSALSAVTGVATEQSRLDMQEGNGGTAVLSGADYMLRLPYGTITSSPTINDKLGIYNGENLGWYGILSLSRGGYDDIYVDRPFPAVAGDEALNQEWKIVRDLLIVRSDDEDTVSSKLVVNAASANDDVGLVAGTYLGSVSGVRIKDSSKDLNFSREDVVAGDVLTLQGPTYTTEHTVLDVTYDGYQIEVTPEVPNDLVAHEYQIDSGGYLSYGEFYSDLLGWFADVLAPSKFSDDIQELERVLNPLLTNRNPSSALVRTAATSAAALRNVYEVLTQILEGFSTNTVPRVDALLDMLLERGMDRAHELLMLGQISDFLGASKDSSSYGGNLLEKMRAIAQNDVPQGRGLSNDNTDSRLTGSYDDADAEFDFSDRDDENGVTEIDDIPDLDDDDDALNRSL